MTMKQTLAIVLLAFVVPFTSSAAPKAQLSEDVEIPIPDGFEACIGRSLEFLAKAQSPEGYWKGQYGINVGENALVMMAFLSQGNLPGEGLYGHVVAKGLNWLMAQAQPSGLIQGKDRAPAMYGHGLATLFLSEVWGQTRRQDVQQVLGKAVDLILRVQGPKGGWSYKSKPQDGDTSVCVIQLFALKSAYEAGMHIPPQVIRKALDLIKTRYNPKEHIFGYNSTHLNETHLGSSAAGTCIMQICQEKDPRLTTNTVNRLIKFMEKGKIKGHRFYFYYYASVACYIHGPSTYAHWLSVSKGALLSSEKSKGGFGHPYQTAFAVLSMSLPYRYIPIYQP